MEKIINNQEKIISLLKKSDPVFSLYKKELFSKIKEKFTTISNKTLLKTLTEDEYFEKEGIRYLFKIKKNNVLDKKPMSIKNEGKKRDEKGIVVDDVFSPQNIEKDLLVDEDFLNRNENIIMFNKFPLIDNHVLMISKDFESQYTHISKSMIESSIILISIMEGMCFFNGGAKSGASQPRKHLQFAPMKDIFKDQDYGLVKYLNDNTISLLVKENNLNKNSCDGKKVESKYIKGFKNNFFSIIDEDEFSYYVKLEIFNNRNHLFAVYKNQLSNINFENSKEIADYIYTSYKYILKTLKLSSDDDINIILDYSLLFNDKFMFITERKTHLLEIENNTDKAVKLNLNTIGFLFNILVKNTEDKEVLKKKDLIKDVFDKL